MVVQAADRDQGTCGSIWSECDLFLNGAQPGLLEDATGKHCLFLNGARPGLLEDATGECIFSVKDHYPTWTMEPASSSLKEVLKACTGWQDVPRPPDNLVAVKGIGAV